MSPSLLFTAALLAAGLSAQVNKPAKSTGLPPLIDRELLFGNPEITGAQLSPDGKYISFQKPWNGTINIWVKKTAEPFSAARLLTSEAKRPIPGYLWSRNSRYILYVKDKEGDENYNVYAVDPAAAAESGSQAPASRDLTGLKGVRVLLYAAPKSDPDVVLIGLNDRDKAWHDLYSLKLSTGERTLLRKNTERVAAWTTDLDGKLRLALRVAPNGDQELLRAGADKLDSVYSCNVFESCGPLRFHKDGKRVYILTNKGQETNLSTLSLLDPESGKVETVESDPDKRADFGNAMFSEATEQLVMTSYTDDRTRRYFKDKALEADYAWLRKRFPGKEIGMGSRTSDEQMMLVTATSDVEPGETYLFDRRARKLTLQYRVREQIPRPALSVMQFIRYKSSDGLEIPAMLTLPKGMPETNLPVLVVPHGGPWARDNWGFNGITQFFANRGYAVFQPNFRGSTGFGKSYLNAGNGEWGRKMQDDITWGVQYLISRGIADPKRIGILGGSYGGYATLAGVAFTPDLYRAGVDIVGPSNLITLLDSVPPYWEAMAKILHARMADPKTEEGKKWLKERSPLTAAARIKTPLLVVQGANDPRVNRGEAEQIVIALRDRGFPVEYLLADDEGHGFARPVNNMAMFMAAEKFLAKHLDGRYQESATPEVAARLKQLTVDPKTVVLTKKADPIEAGAPRPAVDLSPSELKYSAKLSMAGREMALKLNTRVKEDNGAWVAVDTLETPMGVITDSTTIEKGTLIVKKRAMQQGPMQMEVSFDGKKADGTLKMGGEPKPLSVEIGGPVFADGAGGALVVAALPLADGYSTAFRNLDLQKQKVKLMQLKVTGSENVTVPGGTFDAYKVELTPADGGSDKVTIWVAKDSRKPVKLSAVMPQMNGATMITELVE